MTIYLKDLIENPDLLDELRVESPKCECGGPLHEPGEKPYSKDGKEVCGGCYYEPLGELIENHPIVSAGIRRL